MLLDEREGEGGREGKKNRKNRVRERMKWCLLLYKIEIEGKGKKKLVCFIVRVIEKE